MQNSVSCPPFMKIKCFQSTFYRQEMQILEFHERTNYLYKISMESKKLLKENQQVETDSLDIVKALQEFHTFLSQVKCLSLKESCIVLIGHNNYSSTFDTSILLRKSDENFRSKLNNLKVYFGDSQILFKHLLKDKHPVLQLSESASCKSFLNRNLKPTMPWRTLRYL